MRLYRVLTGVLSGRDNTREVVDKLKALGYNQLTVIEVGSIFSVEVFTGYNKSMADKARVDIESVTGKRAVVQTKSVTP